MITSIARQSIIIKCNMQASVLLGNYEFYYASGLFGKLKGCAIDTEILPKDLQKQVLEELEEFSTEDVREAYLVKLLKGAKVTEDYDEQMEELLQMGLEEKNLWQVTI